MRPAKARLRSTIQPRDIQRRDRSKKPQAAPDRLAARPYNHRPQSPFAPFPAPRWRHINPNATAHGDAAQINCFNALGCDENEARLAAAFPSTSRMSGSRRTDGYGDTDKQR
jgi:hypothetical protein